MLLLGYTAYFTFDETIKLIQSDSRENPKVDIDFIVSNFEYIAPAHTFTLRLLGKENGQVVRTGVKYVLLNNEYEATTFEHAVSEKYRELLGRDLNPIRPRKNTTMITDSENGGNITGMPIRNAESTTEIGTDI